jgi:hypothetical protein
MEHTIPREPVDWFGDDHLSAPGCCITASSKCRCKRIRCQRNCTDAEAEFPTCGRACNDNDTLIFTVDAFNWGPAQDERTVAGNIPKQRPHHPSGIDPTFVWKLKEVFNDRTKTERRTPLIRTSSVDIANDWLHERV